MSTQILIEMKSNTKRQKPGTGRAPDSMNRVVINVGIAYGSDTQQARELLINAAHDHPNILDDPPPVATFEGFGDNALNCALRCYLPNLDNRLVTITELNTAIDEAFRRAGIVIAFPQRDIHLDQIGRLDVNVMSNQRPPPEPGPRTAADH